MENIIDLSEVLKYNSTHYFGECCYTYINNKKYSFIKGLLYYLPKRFQHHLYTYKINNNAAYLIRDTNTGLIYIGSTSRIYWRIIKHKDFINSKKHTNLNFLNLLKNTNIKDFELIIIFTNTRDEAYDLEQYFITFYENSGLLLNIAKDAKKSMLGYKVSNETKQKISNANKGNITLWTNEAKQRLSEYRRSNEKAINQFKNILNNKKRRIMVYGTEYESLTQAGELSGISLATLMKIISNKSNPEIYYLSNNVSPLKNSNWTDERKQKLSEFKKNDPKSIAQLNSIRDINKQKVIINDVLYNSLDSASKLTGFSYGAIKRAMSKSNTKDSSGIPIITYTKYHKVKINDIVYNSVYEAAKILNLSVFTIRGRIRSKVNTNYQYV